MTTRSEDIEGELRKLGHDLYRDSRFELGSALLVTDKYAEAMRSERNALKIENEQLKAELNEEKAGALGWESAFKGAMVGWDRTRQSRQRLVEANRELRKRLENMIATANSLAEAIRARSEG